jgi:hypothetical protein
MHCCPPSVPAASAPPPIVGRLNLRPCEKVVDISFLLLDFSWLHKFCFPNVLAIFDLLHLLTLVYLCLFSGWFELQASIADMDDIVG